MQCIVCKKEFTPGVSWQKYCSAECREAKHREYMKSYRLRRKRGNSNKCNVCGKEIETRKHFCDECHGTTYFCRICGKKCKKKKADSESYFCMDCYNSLKTTASLRELLDKAEKNEWYQKRYNYFNQTIQELMDVVRRQKEEIRILRQENELLKVDDPLEAQTQKFNKRMYSSMPKVFNSIEDVNGGAQK